MNKDISLEEYTKKFNRVFADKEENGFSQEELKPLWQSLQNDDMIKAFNDEIYTHFVIDLSKITKQCSNKII